MSIAPYQQMNGQAAVAVPPQAPPGQVSTVAQLVEWAHGAQAAYEVAEKLCDTSFCPKHYQGKPQEATAAILAGLEVGLQPMASLQAFNPIQGSAAPKAITLRAIVLSKGHALDLVESSATRAVVVGRRNGTGPAQTSEWTIERATLMGLPNKNPNWKTQPEAMLIARATSEAARLTAADAILGIPYSYEELADGMAAGPVQAVAEQMAPPAESRRRNRASVLPETKGEPAGKQWVGPEEPPARGSAAAQRSTPLDPNGALRKRLTDLLTAAGHDQAGALAVLSERVGRQVRNTKDLTHGEATEIVAELEAAAAERGGSA